MSKLNDQIVDITRELEKKNLQLLNALTTVKKIMNTDPLTGVFNRRAINKIIHREISFALRHKLPLSIVMVDIDYFKKINDTYGHEMGDYVLKKIAQTIKKSIRKEDIFGRYGGEEFILILPNTDIEKAYQVAERMRQKIEKIKFKGIKEKITASFGLTELLPNDNIKSIIQRGDEALYLAKNKGRNRCEVKLA
ncbi:GGDEF domain-containing protein [Thermodesulfobacterium commune]|uniref:GGDEF domain-containing protein n=1 Tax=Thermodesulfobacterium commune TaxID=1741 RepID=UPI002FDB66A5